MFFEFFWIMAVFLFTPCLLRGPRLFKSYLYVVGGGLILLWLSATGSESSNDRGLGLAFLMLASLLFVAGLVLRYLTNLLVRCIKKPAANAPSNNP